MNYGKYERKYMPIFHFFLTNLLDMRASVFTATYLAKWGQNVVLIYNPYSVRVSA